MIAWLLVGVLAAAEPAACPDLPTVDPGSTMSVAWVAPATARVGARGWLTVTPTDALRGWIARERPGLGRLLQALGLRRRSEDPRGVWVVGVFEVPAPYVCRPLDRDPGAVVAGLAVCTTDPSAGAHRTDGCGRARDAGSAGERLPLFRVRWEDAAARGFCVLPAGRFLSGS